MYNYAEHHRNYYRPGYGRNDYKAFQWYKKAASKGHLQSIKRTSWYSESTISEEERTVRYRKWLEATNLNDAASISLLFQSCIKDEPEDYEKAISLLNTGKLDKNAPYVPLEGRTNIQALDHYIAIKLTSNIFSDVGETVISRKSKEQICHVLDDCKLSPNALYDLGLTETIKIIEVINPNFAAWQQGITFGQAMAKREDETIKTELEGVLSCRFPGDGGVSREIAEFIYGGNAAAKSLVKVFATTTKAKINAILPVPAITQKDPANLQPSIIKLPEIFIGCTPPKTWAERQEESKGEEKTHSPRM